MRKIALITGATSGLGRAIALRLAKEGYDVIITGRRKERLEELEKEIEIKYESKVYSLCFDIRVYNQVEDAINSLPQDWKNIDVLVNNAGLAAGLDPIQKGVVDDWERMIDTNVKGLLYITRIVSPGMVERKSGHIINMGSIAGKGVYPNGAVYCATKYAVNALSQGMRMDMLPYGIRVTQICPGAVDTEFSLVRFKGDKSRADQVYEGYDSLIADDIANAVYFAVTQPAHVDIQDVLVMPTAQATGNMFHKEEKK
ncbi:SDR family NAD(P)-dependent oxidoreductase [Dysgonomonas sp. Marseille-P4677]|uniref:SDR family NAD(P)-dependent oxidoreductase n=1 Tax=Dysgonomonas sp. Marseille-P4677 TaxID=2364790 RepID=UPI00191435B1|nr:SDR family NAD(P)-dependent oxidoreductase [Dysgonomonas sp. Marseille-P4677]MBK5722370.1 SDR family NAD(P)-dependent oxidoreductase [Dysgonomonas sp. Marseille-P4677]